MNCVLGSGCPDLEHYSVRTVRFKVLGSPAPQGSKRPMGVGSKTGKVKMIEASAAVKPWRADVKNAAEKAMEVDGGPLMTGPVILGMQFHYARSRSHFTTKGSLSKGQPYFHVQSPDLSKLIRSTEDALTKVVYVDDRQIFRHEPTPEKVWSSWQGAVIVVRELIHP